MKLFGRFGKIFQHVRKCSEPSRTVPYQSELPQTIRMVRINFNEFPRIDSGRRVVEIRFLFDRGITNKKIEYVYTLNNIGFFKGTFQYYYHATPGKPCKGSPGAAW